MGELPPEVEKKLVEFQNMQEQLQLFASQKMQAKMQAEEIEGAIAAVKEAAGKVFKSAGFVVIESDKETLLKELAEKKESADLRLQVLTRQEDKIRRRVLELKSELEAAAKTMPKGSGA